jgi:hypothetical protein
MMDMKQPWPEREISKSTKDDARTLAAMAAYQNALRHDQTWRAAIRAALAAADAYDNAVEESWE